MKKITSTTIVLAFAVSFIGCGCYVASKDDRSKVTGQRHEVVLEGRTLPPNVKWGPTKNGLSLSLVTVRSDFKAVVVARNDSVKPMTIVSSLQTVPPAWDLLIDGKAVLMFLPSVVLWEAKDCLAAIPPGGYLFVDFPTPAMVTRATSGKLEPGRHTAQVVYKLEPGAVDPSWGDVPVWTGQVSSNVLELDIRRPAEPGNAARAPDASVKNLRFAVRPYNTK